MFTSIGLTVLVSCVFFVGIAGIVMISLRATRTSRSGELIAQVLYNTEHPEKRK